MSQRYDWSAIIRGMKKSLCMSQHDIAVKVNMRQATISHISTGIRKPGIKLKGDLLELARANGMDIRRYQLGSGNAACLRKGASDDLIRLFDLYVRMGKADKIKFLRYAERLNK
ncbi:MAG TPA: hypothetical protein DET40_04825 [Lentisphaeria bacterium]|nr:MAG: hypothetical protein A2X45_13400 [Lentisphaerae bacterium GWF2_50_93]HCE42849.1 hypothetical protein [Lentisphaeria bacterium]